MLGECGVCGDGGLSRLPAVVNIKTFIKNLNFCDIYPISMKRSAFIFVFLFGATASYTLVVDANVEVRQF